MHKQTRMSWQYKRHKIPVSGFNHGLRCTPQTYNTQALEPVRISLYIPDRRNRYDSTPYAKYYDIVIGRRFY